VADGHGPAAEVDHLDEVRVALWGAPVVVVSAVSGRRRTGGHLRRAVFCAQFCWLLLHVAPLRAEALAAPQYTSPA